MKLNVGSNSYGIFNDYINIDNLFHEESFEDFLNIAPSKMGLLEWNEAKKHLIIADGQFLPFKSNTFDEIISNQCVGTYMKEYGDIIRTLKPGGIIEFSIYNKKNDISKLLGNLLINNFEIIDVQWMNGHKDDVDDEDSFSLTIKGRLKCSMFLKNT